MRVHAYIHTPRISYPACILTDHSDADLRKDEIIEKLDTYLQVPSNATRLASNEKFEPYYGSSRRTPFKPRASAGGATSGDEPEVRSVVKGRGKLATAVKKEAE